MKIFLILIIVTLVSSCANTNPQSYDEAYALSKKQWGADKDTKILTEFLNTWVSFYKESDFVENGECKKPQQQVNLVLMIKRDGVIEKVFSQNNDEESNCFVKSLTGLKLNNPLGSYLFHRVELK